MTMTTPLFRPRQMNAQKIALKTGDIKNTRDMPIHNIDLEMPITSVTITTRLFDLCRLRFVEYLDLLPIVLRSTILNGPSGLECGCALDSRFGDKRVPLDRLVPPKCQNSQDSTANGYP